MTTLLIAPQMQNASPTKLQIEELIEGLMASLPDPKGLTDEECRGIIARYSAVLEGNFIYWMTATYLSVQAEEARPILIDNLREEIVDCHPAMLRRFALAADSFPKDTDALAVNDELTDVRLFLGRMSGVQNLLTMAFFEGFIQRFMSYLADLAEARGSSERVYTDVHGVCDIAHTQGLFLALSAEMAINPPEPATDIFEGVDLLRTLIYKVVHYRAGKQLVA
jgi:hypothetical protein